MSTLGPDFEEQNLKRYVKISLILHVAVFLSVTIKATLFNEPMEPFEQAIRVDIVGLPDKVTELPPAPAQETKAPEPPQPKKEEPVAKVEPEKPKLPTKEKPKVEEEAINLNKNKSKQKQALEKLKQMEALAAIEKELENESKKKASQAASQVKYKGNVLNSGTDLRGVNKLQADAYKSNIHHHITMNWSIPDYFKRRNLRVIILIRFDENGNILGKDIVQGSGNPNFDDLVLTTIQKSSPLPPPPAKFVKIAAVEGFQLTFRHDD